MLIHPTSNACAHSASPPWRNPRRDAKQSQAAEMPHADWLGLLSTGKLPFETIAASHADDRRQAPSNRHLENIDYRTARGLDRLSPDAHHKPMGPRHNHLAIVVQPAPENPGWLALREQSLP